jgi:Protein of unknown function (DUF3039)
MTQTTIEIAQECVTDLDSLDTSLDKVWGHYVFPQQDMTSEVEIMALPTVKALCGYVFSPKRQWAFHPDNPTLCPKCKAIWRSR